MLVGEENQGWRLITTQLNHERVMLGPAGPARGPARPGRRLGARPHRRRTAHRCSRCRSSRDTLARVTAAFRVNELLNWEVAARRRLRHEPRSPTRRPPRCSPPTRCSRSGSRSSASSRRYGDPADPETARLASYLDATSKRNLVLTFGGGVNEVQRELIAMFGLGLPKVPR